MIRAATRGDLLAVARTHVVAFPGFFLTTLGISFLKTMYLSFLETPNAAFYVSENDGRIDGFAAAVPASLGGNRKLAVRYAWAFVLGVFPALVRRPLLTVRKLLEQLSGRGTEIPELSNPNDYVLRSICVLPHRQGDGHARALLTTVEGYVAAQGGVRVALTTDSVNNERTIAFYKKNGYQVDRTFRQGGQREMLLMSKRLTPEATS